eukprot:4825557-Prymnesium_polylepis.1
MAPDRQSPHNTFTPCSLATTQNDIARAHDSNKRCRRAPTYQVPCRGLEDTHLNPSLQCPQPTPRPTTA